MPVTRVVIRSPTRRAREHLRGERYCIWDPSWLGSGCGWSERHEDVQKQLKPPDGRVFLRLNGIVIRSHGGFGTEGFADAINLG